MIHDFTFMTVVSYKVTCCWPAYFQSFIYRFYSIGRLFVHTEIVTFCPVKKTGFRVHIQIRLVPYFQIPGQNFIDTIPVNHMLCELLYQIMPFIKIITIYRHIIPVPHLLFAVCSGNVFREKG